MELLESALKETPQLDCHKVLGLEELIEEAQKNVQEVKRRISRLFKKRAHLIYSHDFEMCCNSFTLCYFFSCWFSAFFHLLFEGLRLQAHLILRPT